MRVRVVPQQRSTLVTQVVPAPVGEQVGVLLQARIGHASKTAAREIADGVRVKQRVAVLLADGSRWISSAVKSYGYHVEERDGVRCGFWEVWTEHGKYRLEVIADSAATPVRSTA